MIIGSRSAGLLLEYAHHPPDGHLAEKRPHIIPIAPSQNALHHAFKGHPGLVTDPPPQMGPGKHQALVLFLCQRCGHKQS